MVSSSFIAASLLSLLLPFAAAADHAGNNARHHTDVSKRADGDMTLHKRFSAPKLTWFYASRGVGACGSHVSVGDFVVALNAPQYGNLNARSRYCYKGITIHCRGKSVHATIVDACPECAYGSLDMSTSLFSYFASMDVGEMTGTWEFDGQDGEGQIGGASHTSGGGGGNNNDNGNNDTPKSKSKSKSSTKSKSKTKTPTPTTTHPATTTAAPTTTKAYDFNAGPASGLAIPTGTISSDDGPNNINHFNQIIVGFGGIAVAAASA